MKRSLFLILTTLVLMPVLNAQTADALVAAGRLALTQQNLTNANNSFAAAVKLAPEHTTANVFYAATRLISWPLLPPAQAFMDRLGISATNRNLYHWRTHVPTDTNGVPLAPAGMSAYESVVLIRTNLLPEVSAAAANLSKVTNTNFLLSLSSNETTAGAVNLDYGDVLMLRSFLHAAEYLFYTLHSWNLDLQLSTLRELTQAGPPDVGGLLREHPQLFSFATKADLAAARAAFAAAVDGYQEASAVIRARPPGTNHFFFNYDPDMADSEAKFRQLLTELKASLNGPVVLTANTNLTVDLGRHFAGLASLRDTLPDFQGSAIVAGTVPDGLLGGALQGVPPNEVERFLSKHFDVLAGLGLPIKLADGRWEILVHGLDGQGYAIEASADLRTWTRIAVVTPKQGRLVFDDPLSQGTPRRFYRVVDLKDYLSFAGRLVAGTTGQPVVGAQVTVTFGQPIMTLSTLTDSQGEFFLQSEVRSSSPGLFKVEIQAGGQTQTQQRAQYDENHVRLDLVLSSQPGGFQAPLFWEEFNQFTFTQGPSRSVHDNRGGLYAYFQPMDVAGGVQVGSPIRLREDTGAVDTTFRIGPHFPDTEAVAVQPDGKVLVSGVQGNAFVVIRTDSTGQRDASFQAPRFNRGIRFLTLQPDGKVLLAVTDNLSDAPTAIQVPSPTLYRLNANGSLDSTFVSPVLTKGGAEILFAPPVLDTQGNIYVGGVFDSVNGAPRTNFARLKPNGALDTTYLATAAIAGGIRSSQVRGVGLQADGRAVVAGDFRIPYTAGSADRIGALRFNSDGSRDTSFAAVKLTDMGIGATGNGVRPRALLLLPDDRILLVSDVLVRLNANGSLDSTFTRPTFVNETYWISRMADGRIVVPNLLQVNGVGVGGIAVFSANGTLDTSFRAPGFGLAAHPLAHAIVGNARLVVAGQFNHVGDRNQLGVALLEQDGSLSPSQFNLQTISPPAQTILTSVIAPGPNGTFYYLIQAADAQGTPTTALGRAFADGRADGGFKPAVDASQFADIYAQPDGKLLLLGGGSAQAVVDSNYVRRLLADGSSDASFAGPSTAAKALLGKVTRDASGISLVEVGSLRFVRALNGGKLLGILNGIDGTARVMLFGPDGREVWTNPPGTTVAPTQDYPDVFDPVSGMSVQVESSLFTQAVIADAIDLDSGEVLVCGGFTQFGGRAAPGLVLLKADGTLDTSVTLSSGPVFRKDPTVVPFIGSLAKDAQGRIYLAGLFDEFNGTPVPGLARLGNGPQVDPTFMPPIQVSQYGGPAVALEVAGDALYVFGTYSEGPLAFPRAVWRLPIH